MVRLAVVDMATDWAENGSTGCGMMFGQRNNFQKSVTMQPTADSHLTTLELQPRRTTWTRIAPFRAHLLDPCLAIAVKNKHILFLSLHLLPTADAVGCCRGDGATPRIQQAK